VVEHVPHDLVVTASAGTAAVEVAVRGEIRFEHIGVVAAAAATRATTLLETRAHLVDPDGLADAVAARVLAQLDRGDLPEGMSSWVSADDVVTAVGCSRSKANAYVRAAAGRSVGTGELLRVPVETWEAWARENLINGRRQTRWEKSALSTSTKEGESGGAGSTRAMALSSEEAQARRKRRRLGPGSVSGSKRPLIPALRNRKP
jgi:hypothetical protein